MNSDKLNTWIQLVTGLAIVVGLGLVIWELKQGRDAAKSQLSSDGYLLISQTNVAMLGEDPAAVLAKACNSPDELTTSELILLDNYYYEVLNRITRLVTLSERGSFYTDDYWKDYLGQLNQLFQSHAGRAYWRTVATYLPPKVRTVGNNRLASWDRPSCVDEHALWRQGIVDSMEM